MTRDLDPLIDRALEKDPEALVILTDALLERGVIDPVGPANFHQYWAYLWCRVERTDLRARPPHPWDPRPIHITIEGATLLLALQDDTRRWMKAFGGLDLVMRCLRGMHGKFSNSQMFDAYVTRTIEYALRYAYNDGSFSVTIVRKLLEKKDPYDPA